METTSHTPVVPRPGLTNRSHLYRLVAAKLDSDPLDYIRPLRQQTPPTPFRFIAQGLVEQTGVDVTYEAVRRWWRSTPEGAEEIERQPDTDTDTDPE